MKSWFAVPSQRRFPPSLPARAPTKSDGRFMKPCAPTVPGVIYRDLLGDRCPPVRSRYPPLRLKALHLCGFRDWDRRTSCCVPDSQRRSRGLRMLPVERAQRAGRGRGRAAHAFGSCSRRGLGSTVVVDESPDAAVAPRPAARVVRHGRAAGPTPSTGQRGILVAAASPGITRWRIDGIKVWRPRICIS